MAQMFFRKIGGSWQLRVDTAEDLALVSGLDPARWAATSAPVQDLKCAPAFQAHLDPEKHGRVRAQQLSLLAAWTSSVMGDRGRLALRTDVVRLADLDATHPEGLGLKQTAAHILAVTNAADRETISLAQVSTFRGSYAESLQNGDGVVCPELVPDPDVAALIRDIMTVAGSAPDANGKPGVGLAHVDLFVTRGRAYLDWLAKSRTADGAPNPAVLPWGDDTARAAGLVRDLEDKVEQYFWQCDLARQDERAAERFRPTPEELARLDVGDPLVIEKHLRSAPLAQPRVDGTLSLGPDVNPAMAGAVAALRTEVLARALGSHVDTVDRVTWRRVLETFAPYWAWQAERPTEPFHALGEATVRAHLEGQGLEMVRALIQADLAVAPEVKRVADLEKLVLCHRWLMEVANNFVTFAALFRPSEDALFEAGTLIIDGRKLALCMRVDQREAHRKVAAESCMFLVYASITSQDGSSPAYEVVAPVTVGDRGRLVVGKRGVFRDREGKEWDAQIVDLVENPISLWEAVKTPFRKVTDFVSQKFESLASTRAADKQSALQKLKVGAPPEAGKGGSSTATTSLLLGGGVAFAALGTALTYAVSKLAELKWEILLTLLALAGTLAFLSTAVGWFKLRRRDVGPLLEANGWAVNTRMRLTTRAGALFTRVPGLPRGSRRVGPAPTGPLPPDLEEAERQANRVRTLMWVGGLLAVVATGLLGYRLLTRVPQPRLEPPPPQPPSTQPAVPTTPQ